MLQHFIYVMCGSVQKSSEFKIQIENEFESWFGKIKGKISPLPLSVCRPSPPVCLPLHLLRPWPNRLLPAAPSFPSLLSGESGPHVSAVPLLPQPLPPTSQRTDGTRAATTAPLPLPHNLPASRPFWTRPSHATLPPLSFSPPQPAHSLA